VLTDDELDLALSVLRDGRSIRFDGLGHSIHMDDPERFLAAVLPLLDAFG
jgi:pimeloyl-ACP methyl ester carboxylesterase